MLQPQSYSPIFQPLLEVEMLFRIENTLTFRSSARYPVVLEPVHNSGMPLNVYKKYPFY